MNKGVKYWYWFLSGFIGTQTWVFLITKHQHPSFLPTCLTNMRSQRLGPSQVMFLQVKHSLQNHYIYTNTISTLFPQTFVHKLHAMLLQMFALVHSQHDEIHSFHSGVHTFRYLVWPAVFPTISDGCFFNGWLRFPDGIRHTLEDQEFGWSYTWHCWRDQEKCIWNMVENLGIWMNLEQAPGPSFLSLGPSPSAQSMSIRTCPPAGQPRSWWRQHQSFFLRSQIPAKRFRRNSRNHIYLSLYRQRILYRKKTQ